MTLINCPECNNQVSSTAEACPHCGAPIVGAEENNAAGAPIKTIQETSKKLKLQILISSVIFWVGIVWLFIEVNKTIDSGAAPSQIPSFLLLIGMVWYITTRVRIWWHHR